MDSYLKTLARPSTALHAASVAPPPSLMIVAVPPSLSTQPTPIHIILEQMAVRLLATAAHAITDILPAAPAPRSAVLLEEERILALENAALEERIRALEAALARREAQVAAIKALRRSYNIAVDALTS